MDNSVTPKPQINKKILNSSKKVKDNAKFKAKYFEFYDDIKTHNNGPYDW